MATATTSTGHSLETGDIVTISGAGQSAYNNSFSVIVTETNKFTFDIKDGTGNATGTITGNTPRDKYINIVRNQVNNFDIEASLTDWSTPIIRVYIDGVLNHIAPSGSLGIRISKTTQGWQFKKIKPIVLNEVVVTPNSSGNIYSYTGNDDSVSMRFTGFF